MSKKRRIFDIDMPEELSGPEPETFPAEKVSPERGRRGPMATAISETASSTRERAEIEARIRAENDALAHEHVRLKKLGLVVDLLPLDRIATDKLVRDRAKGPDMELSELKDSIRDIGLSNPIRVEARGDGQYELIQGYRRLSAYRELLAETRDEASWGAIPAAVSAEGASLDDLYRKMVDENLVRKDISFAEMAQLALDYAADPVTTVNDPDRAVKLLFKSASYSKRSYVRTFIKVLCEIGPQLSHASAMPRNLGLALAARLEAEPALAEEIRQALGQGGEKEAEAELTILRRFAGLAEDAPEAPKNAASPKAKPKGGSAKTSIQFDRSEGRVKCAASSGRLEIRLNKDFSAVDRIRLEAAIRAMLDEIA